MLQSSEKKVNSKNCSHWKYWFWGSTSTGNRPKWSILRLNRIFLNTPSERAQNLGQKTLKQRMTKSVSHTKSQSVMTGISDRILKLQWPVTVTGNSKWLTLTEMTSHDRLFYHEFIKNNLKSPTDWLFRQNKG